MRIIERDIEMYTSGKELAQQYLARCTVDKEEKYYKIIAAHDNVIAALKNFLKVIDGGE